SATVPPNTLYTNTPVVSHTATVGKALQAITANFPATVNRDAGTITLDVAASSGLPVAIAVDDELVAGLAGANQLEIRRLGTIRITAIQPGDTNHLPAEPLTATIRVVDPLSDIAVRVHPAVSPNGD